MRIQPAPAPPNIHGLAQRFEREIDRQIDRLVYSLYALIGEEMTIVEGGASPA